MNVFSIGSRGHFSLEDRSAIKDDEDKDKQCDWKFRVEAKKKLALD